MLSLTSAGVSPLSLRWTLPVLALNAAKFLANLLCGICEQQYYTCENHLRFHFGNVSNQTLEIGNPVCFREGTLPHEGNLRDGCRSGRGRAQQRKQRKEGDGELELHTDCQRGGQQTRRHSLQTVLFMSIGEFR